MEKEPIRPPFHEMISDSDLPDVTRALENELGNTYGTSPETVTALMQEVFRNRAGSLFTTEVVNNIVEKLKEKGLEVSREEVIMAGGIYKGFREAKREYPPK